MRFKLAPPFNTNKLPTELGVGGRRSFFLILSPHFVFVFVFVVVFLFVFVFVFVFVFFSLCKFYARGWHAGSPVTSECGQQSLARPCKVSPPPSLTRTHTANNCGVHTRIVYNSLQCTTVQAQNITKNCTSSNLTHCRLYTRVEYMT